MTDPIADMLTRIRNAYMIKHNSVSIPHSKLKESLAGVLKEEGYVEDFTVEGEIPSKNINVTLKYVGKDPAVSKIDRISKPGRRVYIRSKYIKPTLSGFGISILSTSKGLMTDKQAKKQQLGGEVLCRVY